MSDNTLSMVANQGIGANSGSVDYLGQAVKLWTNDLAAAGDDAKEAAKRRREYGMTFLSGLICHVANVVFAPKYSRSLAKDMTKRLIADCKMSEAQAEKYTASIGSALSSRGSKGKAQPIPGLRTAAHEGVESVQKFLSDEPLKIGSFGAFQRAVYPPNDTVALDKIAAAYVKLDPAGTDWTEAVKRAEDARASKASVQPDDGSTPADLAVLRKPIGSEANT